MEKLQQDLSNQDWQVRQAAIAEARHLPPDALVNLINFCAIGRKKLRKRHYNLPLCLQRVVAFFRYSFVLSHPIECEEELRLKQSLYCVIAYIENPAYVGALLTLQSDLLSHISPNPDDYDWELQHKITLSLDRLLAQVQIEDVQAWNSKEYERLVEFLRLTARNYRERIGSASKKSETSLIVSQASIRVALSGEALRRLNRRACAILKIVEWLGGERELPIVKELSALPPRNSLDRELVAAARSCLSVLEARVQSAYLLRASAARQSPDELLRPSLPNSTIIPELELRPAQNEIRTADDMKYNQAGEYHNNDNSRKALG